MDPTKNADTVDAQLLDIMLRAGSRWVLWLLLSLSLVAVAVMLERIWFFIQSRRQHSQVQKALDTMRKSGCQAALVDLQNAQSMEAEVARACLVNEADGAHAVEEHVASTIELQRLRYERGLAFLGTLGNNAPFIGLFGPVLGIIRAFHDLAGNSAAGASVVMAGIAEALVATGIGLLVALPAVAMYNLFARHVETSAAAATGIGHAILAYIKGEPARRERAADQALNQKDAPNQKRVA